MSGSERFIMQHKITWYEEVLAQDPASPLFYNLALLYLEQGRQDKAIEHLKSGLDKNPTHAQGRLLLIHTLSQADFPDQARAYMEPLLSALCSCPQFWLLWADQLQKEGKIDLAAAVSFIGADVGHDSLSWARVMQAGVYSCIGQKNPAVRDEHPGSQAGYEEKDSLGAKKSSDSSQEAEFEGEESGDPRGAEPDAAGQKYFRKEDLTSGGYRTVTMADILAGQGEFESALEIYAELMDRSEDPERRQQIEARMASIQSRMNHEASRKGSDFSLDDAHGPGHEVFSSPKGKSGMDQEVTKVQSLVDTRKKHELLRRLDRLAARLEARF
ncbi:MAG: tetratricopeptide repeat protein [Desulfovermiculus sp.]